MLELGLALILWIPSLWGWGTFLNRRILAPDETAHELGLGDRGLLGIISIASVAIVVHFFIPIYSGVAGAAWLIGIAWFLNAREFWRSFPSRSWTMLGILFALIYIAQGSAFNFDNGSYYLPSLVMDRTFATSVGVGNIQGPLGQSTIWFLTSAMLWLPGTPLAFPYALNSILCFFCFLSFFERLSTTSPPITRLLSIGAILLMRFFTPYCGSISPDPSSQLFVVLTFVSCCEILEDRRLSSRIGLACLYALFGLMCKPTAAGASLGVLITIGIAWNIGTASKAEIMAIIKSRSGVFLISLSTLWLFRNLLLSGCALFPQKASCVSLPWTIPKSTLEYYGKDLLFHALPRVPPNGIWHRSYWRVWFQMTGLHDPLLRFLGRVWALSLLGVLVARIRRLTPLSRNENQIIAFLFFSSLASALFFLALVPVVRFATPYLAGLTLALGALAGRRWLPHWKPTPWIGAGIVFLSLIWAVRGTYLTRVAPVSWIRWPLIPQVKSKVIRKYDDISLISPEGEVRCWSLPPPCSTTEIPSTIRSLPGPRLYATPGPRPKFPWPSPD